MGLTPQCARGPKTTLIGAARIVSTARGGMSIPRFRST